LRLHLQRLRRRLLQGPDSRAARAFRSRMERDGVIVSEEHPRIVAATTFGSHCRIKTPIYLTDSSLGDWSYVEAYCRISHTQIGNFTAIAPGCHIGLAEHPSAVAASSHPVFYRHDLSRGFDFVDKNHRSETTPTTVGNDVWLGVGVIVKGGVTIGDGAIVGAGAVVTKNVPPYAIVAGVPASVKRYRFEQPDIDFLLSIRWWDWDVDVLRRNPTAFHDIAALRQIAREIHAETPAVTNGNDGGGDARPIRGLPR